MRSRLDAVHAQVERDPRRWFESSPLGDLKFDPFDGVLDQSTKVLDGERDDVRRSSQLLAIDMDAHHIPVAEFNLFNRYSGTDLPARLLDALVKDVEQRAPGSDGQEAG